MNDSKEKIAADLAALEIELGKHQDSSVQVLDRVMDIMATASAIDISRASFSLGLVAEAIRPVRVRKTLLATKARLVKALNSKTDQESETV